MQQTRLGRTNVSVSRIGFGALQIATRLEYPAAERLLNVALDKGINILDTARGYWDSEERIGRAISHRRGEFFIATKGGNSSRQDFWESLENSLRLLKTDYIDLYQFHGPGPQGRSYIFEGETVLECMHEAREQGKIRFLGFSSHSVEATIEFTRSGAFDVLQYPISYVGSEAVERGLVEEAKRCDVGFLGMKPFGGGRLGQARYCLGYVFQFPTVVPLIGFETEEELKEAVQLAENDVELTEADRAEMTRIREELGEKFCRGCNYCQPCPENIAIWEVMFLDVFKKQMGEEWLTQESYQQTMQSVARCAECRQCVARCPFNLDIPVVMRGIVEQYEAFLATRKNN